MPTPTETIEAPGYGGFGAYATPVPDQTKVTQSINQGLHNPNNPYPTDPIGGHIELANQAARQTTQNFGKVALFVAEQAFNHVWNPQGANIVNPFIITNAFPAEGILKSTFDGRNEGLKRLAEPQDVGSRSRAQSAIAGGTLGQEEGAAFFGASKVTTLGSFIDYGINALAGALGIKENNSDLVPLSPKSATLERRLTQNFLSPEATGNEIESHSPRDAYEITYSRKFISGVKTEDLSKGFVPIQDGAMTQDSLLSDVMLRDNLERGFESNAPLDARNRSYTFMNGVDLVADPDADASSKGPDAPPIQGSGTIFPFYFESMNSFAGGNLEKFCTFQATFNGLKETYTPQWDQKIYFGRSTPSYTYNSTNRTVGFGFVIWAPNRIALGLVKQRINWLAKHCYPSYDKFGSTRIVKEAPIIKFTIGDIFKNTPGIITNLTYDWNDRWELTRDLIMPQLVKVDIQITVIHDKFMQNFARSESLSGNISSDFYEYIKPPMRGIGKPSNRARIVGGKVGKLNSQLTESETNSVVKNKNEFDFSNTTYNRDAYGMNEADVPFVPEELGW